MLHPKRELVTISAVLFLLLSIPSVSAWSQVRKKEKGPRALGVIEIAPNGKARLIPITILVGDQWYDAGIYMASPRPMALDPQTVYEGEKSGEPEGLFTVSGIQQMGRNWIGLGTWKPKGSEPAPKKITIEGPANAAADGDEDRPILRRSKPATGSDASAAPVTAPQSSSPASTASTTAPPTTEQKTAEAKTTPEPVQKDPVQKDEDAARPILRRGKPGVEQAANIPMPSSPEDFPQTPVAAKATSSKSGAEASHPVIMRTLAAISDARGPQPHSYAFITNPGEREDYSRRVAELASQALRKFVATRSPGHQAPVVTVDNSRTQIFDLSNNNEAVLVLSARVPGDAATVTTVKKVDAKSEQPATANLSGPEYYVTVVARVDVTGDLRKLLTSVTDSTRLDAYPKLDLIDAVDANGDGVGELLFRQTYDRSRAYVLYRVGMDQLWELFEGAQSGF